MVNVTLGMGLLLRGVTTAWKRIRIIGLKFRKWCEKIGSADKKPRTLGSKHALATPGLLSTQRRRSRLHEVRHRPEPADAEGGKPRVPNRLSLYRVSGTLAAADTFLTDLLLSGLFLCAILVTSLSPNSSSSHSSWLSYSTCRTRVSGPRFSPLLRF